MKIKELALAGLTYVVAVASIHFVTRGFGSDAAGASQAGGTFLAVCVASWRYQSRNERPAPAKVKLAVGATLAALCVLQGVAFQMLLNWRAYPAISIFFGALGALAFPFLFWNVAGKSVTASWRR